MTKFVIIALFTSSAFAGCCNSSGSSGGPDPIAPKTTGSSAATIVPSSPPAPTAASGLATLFSGAPDSSTKLAAAVPAKMANLMIQSPSGWSLTTEADLGWQLISPDHKVQLQLSEVKPGAAFKVPRDGVFIGYTLKSVKANSPTSGTIGKFALPAQIVDGTALIDGQKEAGKVYYFVIQTGGKMDVEGIAMVRAGATPQQNEGLIAAVRSIRRSTDK